MTKNFRVYVDRGGNMPQLRHSVWDCDTHPYYIRYINDRPVAYHGPVSVVAQNVSRDSVWCYLRSEFVSINSLTAE
mgnify:FL=1|jgi:hypothetical protein